MDVHGLQPGPGTYRVDGRTYASVLGLLSRRPPVVRVIPLSGRYIPKPKDVVVGTVTDVQTTFWLLDIGAPRWAPLHMTGTPWKIDVGECGQYLHVGDTVVVAIESLDPTGRIGVTMLGDDLGKVDGGTVIPLSPAKVPRLIGRGGSMIQMLTQQTGCRIAVGQNGRIWVDGPAEGMVRVREAIRLIEEEGQRSGLTERVAGYLGESTPRNADGSPGPMPTRPPFEPPSPIDDGDDSDDDAGPAPF
ncbi:MAG: exosome complex RNA-binding protein Rrp4 [Thermoplasmata archaeon]|nr:exosome complex RNA-binding protein Rrp4 [Thermoplasmata archaeon]